MGNGCAICTHENEGHCCFRKIDRITGLTVCDILSDCKFNDEICHFRKFDRDGVNLYDCATKGVDPTVTIHIKMVDGYVLSNWE